MLTSLFEPIAKLDWSDIQAFLDQRLPEGERIDYKAELNPRVAESIGAMANTRGGIIVVGVEEDAEKKPVLPPKGISVDQIKGGSLGNFCRALLQPLYVPHHPYIATNWLKP